MCECVCVLTALSSSLIFSCVSTLTHTHNRTKNTTNVQANKDQPQDTIVDIVTGSLPNTNHEVAVGAPDDPMDLAGGADDPVPGPVATGAVEGPAAITGKKRALDDLLTSNGEEMRYTVARVVAACVCMCVCVPL